MVQRRFIPTGVGNTWQIRAIEFQYPVHPHGRGEHDQGASSRVDGFGSSPRAWGTHQYSRTWRWLRRFIPTGVGNTEHHTPAMDSEPVHPHGRGEHYCSRLILNLSDGSSPRAWGTHFFYLAEISAIKKGPEFYQIFKEHLPFLRAKTKPVLHHLSQLVFSG